MSESFIPTYEPLGIARQFLYVREVPPNHGLRVNGIQRWCGGNDGDPWCCEFATMVLDIAYQGKSPIPRTGDCDVVYAVVKDQGWLTPTPVPGDLYFRVDQARGAHHIGFVTQFAFGQGHFVQLSGNTTPDGTSVEGVGVFEKDILLTSAIQFAHIPR